MLAIPERKGNSLGLDPRNVLATSRIGLIFFEEAFRHCGKATIRAKLWAAPDESVAERSPIAEQIGELLGDENLVAVVAADLEQNYRDGLY